MTIEITTTMKRVDDTRKKYPFEEANIEEK